ncbi:MAG TPA: SPOR domain-containing protein [Saprospiraceae bacterium]|nr:SPOR domain-containing protein [Saprospiraceae bacterium]
MRTQIINSLNHLLFEQEYITIPSFGSFELKQQSAIVDPVSGKIHPPGSEVHFSETIQAKDQLLKWTLVNQFGYSSEEADLQITRFVRDIKTKLEQREIVYLDGIGKLFLDQNGQISFLPTTFNYTPSNFGLPDVAYAPIQERVPQARKKEKKSFFRTRMSAQSLTLLTVLAFTFISVNVYFLAKRNMQKQPTPIAQTVHINQKPSSILPSPTQFMDEITNIDTEEKEDKPSHAQPAIEVEDELFAQETVARTINNNECIIIAGTFSAKKNAAKMIQKLLDQGYAPYKDKKGKNWRVGIIFPYNSIFDIKRNLEDLSKTYHTNAWILKR